VIYSGRGEGDYRTCGVRERYDVPMEERKVCCDCNTGVIDGLSRSILERKKFGNLV
jgi:hypothetical protein